MDETPLYFVNRKRLADILTLLAWTGFLLHLAASGRYKNYLHPSLLWLLAASCTFFLILAAARAADIRVRHEHDAECAEGIRPCAYAHRLRLAHLKHLLIFSLPVLVVFLLPLSRGLSATMVGGIYLQNPQVVVARSLARERERPRVNGFPEYYISEVNAAAEKLPGTVSVIGMVYKSSSVPRPRFLLVRFYITCCAADARPVMLEIDPSGVPGFSYRGISNNQWTAVTGTAHRDPDSGKVIFSASAVAPIPPPEDEYIY